MKRLLLVFTILLFAILALRYFSQGSRKPTAYDPERDEPGAVSSVSGGRYSEAGASNSTSRVEPRSASAEVEPQASGTASSVWQRFLDFIAPPSKPGTPLQNANAPHVPAGIAAIPQSSSITSISGRVRDEAGQPVYGIELTAEPLGSSLAQQGAPARGPVAQARSDEQGAYRFDYLPEGEYRIRTVPTLVYLPAETVVRTGVDSADLVVLGEHLLLIQGRVKDSRGRALQGVRVTSIQSPSGEVDTDQNGGYQLQVFVTFDKQDYALTFQLAGYNEEVLHLQETQIYSRGPVQLDATLSPIRSLVAVAGRITNTEGVPFPGVMIQLLGEGALRYQAVTNRAGEFMMAEVEANQTYKFWMPARDPYEPYSKQVEVGPRGLWQDVILRGEKPETGFVSGRMLNADGNPLPRFTLWLQSDNPAAGKFLLVTSDDTGRYAIDNVPVGRLSFTTLSTPRLRVTGIVLTEAGAQSVDLILDWGGYDAQGQVVGPDGTPVPGSRVDLSWFFRHEYLQSSSERRAESDANGFFRFAQLGPGVHTVRVSAPGFRTASVELDIRGNPEAGAVFVQLERN